MAEGLRVHPDVMREHLDLTGGLIVSERLVAVFTPLLGRARAKRLLSEAARRTRVEGRTLAEVLGEILADFGESLSEEAAPEGVAPEEANPEEANPEEAAPEGVAPEGVDLAALATLCDPARLSELTDPTRYTGSAGTLTDRALERR